MKLNELLKLLEKHNIPDDVTLMSNSGWECGATDMDGVYYNRPFNTLVFTQGSCDDCDVYSILEGWETLKCQL